MKTDDDDEAMRWFGRTLAWEHTMEAIRNQRLMAAATEGAAVESAAVEVPARPAEPIGLREPERTPLGAPPERVPRRDHRVA